MTRGLMLNLYIYLPPLDSEYAGSSQLLFEAATGEFSCRSTDKLPFTNYK